MAIQGTDPDSCRRYRPLSSRPPSSSTNNAIQSAFTPLIIIVSRPRGILGGGDDWGDCLWKVIQSSSQTLIYQWKYWHKYHMIYQLFIHPYPPRFSFHYFIGALLRKWSWGPCKVRRIVSAAAWWGHYVMRDEAEVGCGVGLVIYISINWDEEIERELDHQCESTLLINAMQSLPLSPFSCSNCNNSITGPFLPPCILWQGVTAELLLVVPKYG